MSFRTSKRHASRAALGDRLIVNSAFDWRTLPPSVAVVGAGVIGLEPAQALQSLVAGVFGRELPLQSDAHHLENAERRTWWSCTPPSRRLGALRVHGSPPDGRCQSALMIRRAAPRIGHLLGSGVLRCDTVQQMLDGPVYPPVVKEGLRKALRRPTPTERHLACGPEA